MIQRMKFVLSRYHWLVITLSIIVLLVVAGEIVEGLVPLPQGSGFGRADSEKIKLGMNEEEVVEVLGTHSGNYASGEWGVEKLPRAPEPGLIRKEWASDTGVIWVYFDEKGRVSYVLFQKPTLLKEPFLRRLLKKLGLK